jgi:hypothetical protein
MTNSNAKEQFTKEQKKEYFTNLRNEWKLAKEKADKDQKMKDAYEEMKLSEGSYWSFYFTLIDMQSQKMEGFPYLDAKTFNKWKEEGFIVKKGEKSKLRGLVWKSFTKDKDDKLSTVLYPKVYNLFHRSQVEVINN